MSLKDAGTLLGLKPNSVRSRYKKGQIRGEADNMGKLWVYLDPSIEPPSKVSIEPTSNISIEPVLSGEISALKGQVNVLSEQLAKADAELAVLRPLATDNARLEAEGAGIRAQIDEAHQRIDDLKADREQWRQQANTLLLKVEKSQPEAKGFWKRLLGG